MATTTYVVSTHWSSPEEQGDAVGGIHVEEHSEMVYVPLREVFTCFDLPLVHPCVTLSWLLEHYQKYDMVFMDFIFPKKNHTIIFEHGDIIAPSRRTPIKPNIPWDQKYNDSIHNGRACKRFFNQSKILVHIVHFFFRTVQRFKINHMCLVLNKHDLFFQIMVGRSR
jgi:hypothetical protein